LWSIATSKQDAQEDDLALVFQVLSLNDIDEVHAFALARLQERIPDEIAQRFASWSAKWRRESLEHYLKLGWSFIARDSSGATAGFFLAQPFLFFRGQTQTVWVEHVEARDPEAEEQLVDIAVRVSREKHMQTILFADADSRAAALAKWRPVRLTEQIFEVRTTKG
jgi:hypothetical protein